MPRRTAATHPPSGIPASGTPKGGNGPGWGGPAKGSNPGSEKAPNFEVANRMATLPPNERGALRRQRAAEMEDQLYALATDAEHEAVRLAAMRYVREIAEGGIVAKNLNVNASDLSSLSDRDIDAELARIEGATAKAAPRETPPDMPRQPAGVVH